MHYFLPVKCLFKCILWKMSPKIVSTIFLNLPWLSQQTHYVTTTLPTGCILVKSVLTLPVREGYIRKLRNFTTLWQHCKPTLWQCCKSYVTFTTLWQRCIITIKLPPGGIIVSKVPSIRKLFILFCQKQGILR